MEGEGGGEGGEKRTEMYSDYTTGVYKRTQQNKKRLTFVRIERNIFSQS